jgi:mannan endo-1,4-beta-mannosidase
MIWNVMGHDAQCCNYVQHNDGYSLLYPDGNSAADQANILQVVKHWYKVTGRSQPSKLPAVACPQPVF